jgi:hypothetical protein
MDYLLIHLWIWVLGALLIGFATGWLSCSGNDEQI